MTSAQRESQQYRAENGDNDGSDAAGPGGKKCEHLGYLFPSRLRSVGGEIPIQEFTRNSDRNKSKDPAHHTSRFARQALAGRVAGCE